MNYLKSDPVRLNEDRNGIIIIDQTRLPNETVYSTITGLDEMYDAISDLAVRGAPCIGVFAGYCMAVLSLHEEEQKYDLGCRHEAGDLLGLSGGNVVSSLKRNCLGEWAARV